MDLKIFLENYNRLFPFGILGLLDNVKLKYMDPTLQVQSFGYSDIRDLTNGQTRETIVWDVPNDYFYFFYTLNVGYPGTAQGNASPPLYFELLVPTEGKNLNTIALANLELMSSPTQYRILRNSKPFPYIYRPSSQIQINISNFNGTDPDHVDLLTEGLLIPKKEFTGI